MSFEDIASLMRKKSKVKQFYEDNTKILPYQESWKVRRSDAITTRNKPGKISNLIAQAVKIYNIAALKYWWMSVERAITWEMMGFGERLLKESEIYNRKLNGA